MDVGELARRYDDELRTHAYTDLDASVNGLQVGNKDTVVDHVAFAVDAAGATIDRAIEVGADAMVVHHGLSWDGIDRITDRTYERLQPLLANDVALYVSHLPLDGHPTLGNAAALADLIDLVDREPFGTIGEETIGVRGRLADGYDADALAGHLEQHLSTGDRRVQSFGFGPDRIQTLVILTGSGADWLDEAIDHGVDALVTGEGKGHVYHDARDAGITVLLAGHYATETGGVRNLQTLAEDWGLTTTFIDHPTEL